MLTGCVSGEPSSETGWTPSIVWETTINGDSRGVAVGEDGTIYLAGAISDGGVERPWLASFGSTGVPRWEEIVEERGVFNAVEVSPNGNVIVCGNVSSGSQGMALRVSSYSADGEQRWNHGFDTEEVDDINEGRGVAIDSQGRVLVAGTVGGSSGEGGAFTPATAFLRQLNADGEELWTQIIGEHGAHDVSVGSDDSVVLVGFLNHGVWDMANSSDAVLWRFSADGELLISTTRETSPERPFNSFSAVELDDGSIFVTGSNLSVSKYSSTGDLQWLTELDVPDASLRRFHGLALLDDEIISVGQLSMPDGETHGVLLQLDSEGTLLRSWIGGEPNRSFADVAVHHEGGLVLIGAADASSRDRSWFTRIELP